MRKSVDIKDWSRNVVIPVFCARVSEGSDLSCNFAMTQSGNSFTASGKKQNSSTHDWVTDEAHVWYKQPSICSRVLSADQMSPWMSAKKASKLRAFTKSEQKHCREL